ncbi:unnamed protein product [Pleuronectes platessa]|uniref:Uncharacterized protein n=1 Tax=Pleuronectes platessa TaxID=8262 RepID=A0A9N7YAU5_PLEPL|nr:unnamed protein product [Pleuronectes platessa]
MKPEAEKKSPPPPPPSSSIIIHHHPSSGGGGVLLLLLVDLRMFCSNPEALEGPTSGGLRTCLSGGTGGGTLTRGQFVVLQDEEAPLLETGRRTSEHQFRLADLTSDLRDSNRKLERVHLERELDGGSA